MLCPILQKERIHQNSGAVHEPPFFACWPAVGVGGRKVAVGSQEKRISANVFLSITEYNISKLS